MDEGLLAEHVDELYAADRADFVAERDRRAKQLREDGHREEATALGRRRKPTLAAWAVDQAVRRDRRLVDDLLDAATALGDAQEHATSGGQADQLRSATREVHRLVDALADVADGVLDEVGAGAHHDEVRQTLLATALDPAMHADLQRGVLERATEHVGFGGLMGTGAASREDAAEAARMRSRRRELEQHRDALRRSLEEERTRAERARRRADELRQRAERAEADADEAGQAVDRVSDELERLDAELDELSGT